MITLSKKICMLGDFAVGKTSLMRRFVEGVFEDKYLSTIGVKVDRKAITVSGANDTTQITMMVWDLAGSEKFNQMRANYLRGAAGAILVCDLTRPDTLASLQNYADDLYRVSPEAHLVLAANKADLTAEHRLTPAQIEVVAANLDAPFYLTSAKTGETVETAFYELGQRMIA